MSFASTGVGKGVTASAAASAMWPRGVDSGVEGVGLPRRRWSKVEAVVAMMVTSRWWVE
jgi:hypothetical protein